MAKENKKVRFNIIDLIIILFVILALVGIFLRYDMADQLNLSARGEVFEVEFIVRDIMRGTEHHLHPGATLHIGIDSVPLGVITEIWDVRDSLESVNDIYGEIMRSYQPDRVDVIGVMRSTGRTTSEGYRLINGNAFVTTGSWWLAHTGFREVVIRVIDVTTVTP